LKGDVVACTDFQSCLQGIRYARTTILPGPLRSEKPACRMMKIKAIEAVSATLANKK
jgi:hypothetical protein